MDRPIESKVTDWASDFDHADPAYNRHAHQIWDDLRSRCPVAHSDRYGGVWLPVTHELVREIAYDTEHFTSRSVVVSTIPPTGVAPVGSAPPITSDPPVHREARRLLLPVFAPKTIEAREASVRALCRRRLDEMGPITPGTSVVDAARTAVIGRGDWARSHGARRHGVVIAHDPVRSVGVPTIS